MVGVGFECCVCLLGVVLLGLGVGGLCVGCVFVVGFVFVVVVIYCVVC